VKMLWERRREFPPGISRIETDDSQDKKKMQKKYRSFFIFFLVLAVNRLDP